jgi:cytochrome c oxidase assembly protein subunit 15
MEFPTARARPVAIWLYICCALIFIMVVVGGLTRLTESGLSIVEWQPVSGILPPLNDAQWAAEFARYQTSPQFRAVNFWMTLADFRTIYWLEYVHRLLGRAIGLVFLLPLLWFVWRRRIDRPLMLKLGGIFVLGALQGVLGWYMVRSGLVHEPAVSHYRLAAHLSLALAIGGAMLWTAFAIDRGSASEPAPPRLRHAAVVALCWLSVTIVWGAFVAGLDAGAMYNTFPLMDGRVVPEAALALTPWPLNLVENPAMVQFVHRCLAISLVAIVAALWAMARRAAPHVRRAADLLLLLVLLQAALGITTLLTGVDIAIAVLHQANAVLLLAAALWLTYTTMHGARLTHAAAGTINPAVAI